jgi:hypothetical protein
MVVNNPGRTDSPTVSATDVTLVFAPESGPYGKVREVVGAWANHGLVKDSIWIDLNSDPNRGSVIKRAGGAPVVVLEELAARSVRRLRAISLLLATTEEEASSLPSGEDQAQSQERYRILAAEANIAFTGGLVVATLPHLAVPERCFHPGWRFNLIVSPEDGVADDRIGVELNPDSLPGVAAAALVTASGLWAWSDEARIDTLTPDSGSSDAEVRLARSYVRIIDGAYSLDEIADAALTLDHSTGTWPLPFGESPGFVQADDPKSAIVGVGREFVEVFSLTFTPLKAPPVDPPTRKGLWEGIKLFFRTIWDIVLDVPVKWVEGKRHEVEQSILKFFTDHTFGGNSSVVLTLRGHSLAIEDTEATGMERFSEISRLAMPGANAIVAEPRLWSGFWTVGCGLADGSEFPMGVSAVMRGTSQVLIPIPDFIVPDADPEQSFTDQLFPDLEILPVDVFAASELEQCLKNAIEGKSTSDSAAANLETPAGETAPMTESLSSSRESTDVSGASTDDSVELAAFDRTERVIDAGKLEKCDTEQLQRALVALRAWSANRNRDTSFAWNIGGALGTGVVEASRELADALALISKGEAESHPSEDEEKQAHRFRRFIRAALVVAAGLLVLILGLAIGGIITVLTAAIIGPVLIIAGTFGVLKRFVAFATAQARAQFERNQKADEYWFAFNRAYAAAAGLTRFCSLYWQYLDWATALSILVREPWGREASRSDHGSMQEMPHPLSITIGNGEVSADQFQRRVAAARQEVSTRGWLRTALERHVQKSSARYSNLMHVTDPAAADGTRDTSPLHTVVGTHAVTGEPISSPRCQVRADAVDRRFSTEARLEEAGQITATTLQQPLDELFSSVSVPPPAGRGLTGHGIADFLSYLVPNSERQPRPFPPGSYRLPELHPPGEVQLALPDVVTVLSSKTSFSTVPASTPVRYGERFVIGAHRMDLSEPCSPSKLSLVKGSDDGVPEAPGSSRSPTGDDGIAIP